MPNTSDDIPAVVPMRDPEKEDYSVKAGHAAMPLVMDERAGQPLSRANLFKRNIIRSPLAPPADAVYAKGGATRRPKMYTRCSACSADCEVFVLVRAHIVRAHSVLRPWEQRLFTAFSLRFAMSHDHLTACP